jgi:hypothetical protein
MQIKLYYFIQNNGDGSASPVWFTSKETLHAYMEAEENDPNSGAFCDADGELHLDVNPETNEVKILNAKTDRVHYTLTKE